MENNSAYCLHYVEKYVSRYSISFAFSYFVDCNFVSTIHSLYILDLSQRGPEGVIVLIDFVKGEMGINPVHIRHIAAAARGYKYLTLNPTCRIHTLAVEE